MSGPKVLPALVLALCAACGGGSTSPDAGPGGPDAPPVACPDPASAFSWPVPTGPIDVPAHDSWKGEVSTTDPFFSSSSFSGDEPTWIKFSVLLRDPTRVYFQDSSALRFHYEFASAHLPPLAGMTPAQFDAVSLHAAGQEVVLGAVLVPPAASGVRELGVQLVGLDAYHPQFVKTIFDLVVSKVQAPAGTRALYLPVTEQARCAAEAQAWFEANGVPLGTADRWGDGNACYAPGWAVGRLVRSTAATIDAEYLAGAITADDIVLLADAAPAEVPPIAGLLTLAASTPNSHTAILAQAYGMPFSYLRLPEVAARADALVGRTVVIGTRTEWFDSRACEVTLIDVTDVPSADLAAIRALKRVPVLAYPAKVARGAIAVDVDDVGRSDARTVGGKAANYGLLRDVIPAAAPEAVALTFDLWDAFLDQVVPGGGTLRAAIGARLAPHRWPPDMLALDADLDALRAQIRTGATFSPAQAQAIAAALAGFDPSRRLRFRSSTNVEDGDTFVGAGLYDSFTGCLADDLDDDAVGPSACDPTEPDEQGALRAIQRTYASFYRRNAVLERLRRGVDEAEVGMAVLVTYSYPDATEAANGVATFTRHGEVGFAWDTVVMVTQVGATSVANPADGSTPEVVELGLGTSSQTATLRAGSSLLPLGANVLTWDQDYFAFAALFDQVADAWGVGTFTLDFEYKLLTSGQLIVKQVRAVPPPDTTVDVTPYLAHAPTRLCVYQGESSDVFAIHHAKSRWELDSKNTWLTPAAQAQSLLSGLDATVHDGAGARVQQAGAPDSFAGFTHGVAGEVLTDTLRIGTAPGRFVLSADITPRVARNERPVQTLGEQWLSLGVTWDTPRWVLDWNGLPAQRREDQVPLTSRCPDDPLDTTGLPHVERTVTVGPITVQAAYYWPKPPRGPIAGYTAPLVRWDETTITGLTASPITLRGYWSQSYRPAHHNFGAEYIFEPGLEDGLPPAVLAELVAADVRALYVREDLDATMLIIGLDGTLRAVP